MPSSVPARSDDPAGPSAGPAPSAAASEAERAEVITRIVAATDEGTLDLDDAGRLVSLAHRARLRGELARIGRRLDDADEVLRSAARRRQQWRSLGLLAVCVLVSVLMVVGLVYGLGPIDPH
jgi:hypothetical protein